MSRSRRVEDHLKQLGELQSIIVSMKTLSQLELHKLSFFADSQSGMMQVLEQMATDFLSFFPRTIPEAGNVLWLLIGSERGFCGGFNEILVKRLFEEWPQCIEHPEKVVSVGHKLCWRLDERLPGYAGLAGASASEEIPSILRQVVITIQNLLMQQNATTLRVLYHSDERDRVISRQLLPPEMGAMSDRTRFPPALHLDPELFFSGFLQHYLLLGLTQLFSVSLLAENRHRVQHLGGAARRLDDQMEILHSKARSLRQEEITEEIEMILLGSGAFDLPSDRT
jgi:F-type H+-transporting ATPase subunit gamma